MPRRGHATFGSSPTLHMKGQLVSVQEHTVSMLWHTARLILESGVF